MTTQDFLIEEYRANWHYIRHQEDIRLRLHQLYLTITAALLSVLAALFKFSNSSNMEQFITGFEPILVAMSLFLAVYGFLYLWFMRNQKLSYELYRNNNSEIRKLFYSLPVIAASAERDKDVDLPAGFTDSMSGMAGGSSKLDSPFIAWATLPAVISIAAAAIGFFIYF